MRAPDFWRAGSASPWPALLAPLSLLWRLGGALRSGDGPDPGVPVISIGNIVAGGAGKTPTAIAVAERLIARGHQPHFISRGYGGRIKGPHRLDLQADTARDVGDEPLLLAAIAPAWVARNRHAGAQAAKRAGADCVILDDAHQNRTVHKSLSLVVVDAAYGFGNGRVMPAGPLREPLAAGLARADAIVLIGEGRTTLPLDRTVLRAHLEPDDDALRHKRVFAFAGIGRPEKFFQSLRDLQCEIAEAVPFPDHHAYTPDEVIGLVDRAVAQKAVLVTTEKDRVRLPPEARGMVKVLPVRLHFRDDQMLDQLLERALSDG
jgi:tetraacyldisaccharide 4'-kinase